jgi:hypothetical protein
VSQTKFDGLGAFRAARNSWSSEPEVVRKWLQREAVFISENDMNAKWSPPLGGLKLQVPEPEESSANNE